MTIYTANRACALLYEIISSHSKGTYLIPANMCPTVPLTIGLSECDFEFVDIDKDTLCINEEVCLSKLKKHPHKYAGMIFVRTYGYIYDTNSFFQKLHSYKSDFTIIDDRCLCLPSFDSDLGEADFILYSTGYGKQVNLGFGGYCKTQCSMNPNKTQMVYKGMDIEEYYKNIVNSGNIIKNIPHGWLSLDDIDIPKEVYFKKINEYIQNITKHKTKINSIYTQELNSKIQLPSAYQNWRYNIFVSKEEKQEILTNLFRNNPQN